MIVRTRFTALAAFGVVLSACTVEVDAPPPGSPPTVCPRIYAPVCAAGFGERRTFPNACEARADGYRVIRDGECRRDRPPVSEPVICPQIYAPVCARRGGVLRTFPNACVAEGEGWRVVDRGRC